MDVAYAFIYKEDAQKILMVNNTGAGWSLPGGAVEEVPCSCIPGQCKCQDHNCSAGH